MQRFFSAISVAVILIVTTCAASRPAQAICVSPRLFNSGTTYVVTPGCEAADCGSSGGSVTDELVGAFWAIGDGDVDLGAGLDSGAFPARGGWLFEYPGYPALINSTWAASAAIDGCIDFASDARRCMALLLMDHRPDAPHGVFALMTRAADPLGNYDFSLSGEDIVLGSPGRLTVTNASFPDLETVVVTVRGVDPLALTPALYLDPECGSAGDTGPGQALSGYQVFARVLPRGTPAPEDSDADGWQQATGTTALGEPVIFAVDCAPNEDLWLRAGIVFDSGFRSRFLSEQSTRLECVHTLADPEDLVPRKPRNREQRPHKPGTVASPQYSRSVNMRPAGFDSGPAERGTSTQG